MSQRLQRAALGTAILAVALVTVALIVAIRRGGAHGTSITARTMHARDLARLSADTVERADGGVHVQPTVAAALGLSPRDTIFAISGRTIATPGELDAVLGDLQRLHPAQWFVELSRDGAHVLERWDLDGGGATPGDPMLTQIKRVGAARFELPRAAIFDWMASPARLLAGVASLRHLANGLELQTVRPGSLVAALGFEDGDLIRAINGVELAPLDDLAEVAPLLSHASQLTLDVRRRGAPVLLNYVIR